MSVITANSFTGSDTFPELEEPAQLLLHFVDDDGKEFTVAMDAEVAAQMTANAEAALQKLTVEGRPVPKPMVPERVVKFDAVRSRDEQNEVLLVLSGDRATHTLWRLQTPLAKTLAALLMAAADEKPASLQ